MLENAGFIGRRGYLLGLAGAATDLGKQEINAERRVLVGQVALELRDLLSEHVRCVTDATDDTEAAGVGDSSSELGTSSHVHASQHDGVLDLQQVGELGAELLWSLSAAILRCYG